MFYLYFTSINHIHVLNLSYHYHLLYKPFAVSGTRNSVMSEWDSKSHFSNSDTCLVIIQSVASWEKAAGVYICFGDVSDMMNVPVLLQHNGRECLLETCQPFFPENANPEAAARNLQADDTHHLKQPEEREPSHRGVEIVLHCVF